MPDMIMTPPTNEGDRVVIYQANYFPERVGEVARVIGPEPGNPEMLRVMCENGRRDQFGINEWLRLARPQEPRCEVADPDPEADGVRCDFPAGHSPIPDVETPGMTWEHADPAAGAWFNPSQMGARPEGARLTGEWRWRGAPVTGYTDGDLRYTYPEAFPVNVAAERLAQYPARFRVGSTGYLEEFDEERCTCDGSEFGHHIECGWEPVVEIDLILDFVRAMGVLRELSVWIDDSNGHRHPEARTWGRIAKAAKEIQEAHDAGASDAVVAAMANAQGRVVAAMIEATGQNPRKFAGDGSMRKVTKELDDVGVTALAADESIHNNDGQSIVRFLDHVLALGDRMRESIARQEIAERR